MIPTFAQLGLVQEDTPPEWFWWMFGCCAAWVLFVYTIGAWWMHKRGRPILAKVPEDAIFHEKRRHVRGELWGGFHFLIALTPNELVVRAHYPASVNLHLFVRPLSLPQNQVHEIERGKRRFAGEYVAVTYDLGRPRPYRVELFPRDIEGFHRTLLDWKKRGCA